MAFIEGRAQGALPLLALQLQPLQRWEAGPSGLSGLSGLRPLAGAARGVGAGAGA